MLYLTTVCIPRENYVSILDGEVDFGERSMTTHDAGKHQQWKPDVLN